MKIGSKLMIGTAAAVLFSASLATVNQAVAQKKTAAKKTAAKKPAAKKPAAKKPAAKANPNAGKVVLPLVLPPPAFLGTPKAVPAWSTVDRKSLGKRRPAFFVPKGVTLLSKGKPVTSSDERPIIGSLDLITDGEKRALDGNWVELAFGKQWVQIDLQKAANIYAIVLWHFHGEPRIYKDVVVQVADDPDFITNVRTLFNSDQDNSSGLGLGKDREYFESAEGKLIPVNGIKARYLRLYSNGSSSDDQNHYTEIEVWGK